MVRNMSRRSGTALLDIALAGLNVDRGLREAIIGDLTEERTELASVRGERFARWWMARQILRSMPVLAHAAFRAAGNRAAFSIVMGAVVALAAVLAVATVSAAVAFEAFSPETMARFAVVALAIDLAYGIAGGYLAARLGRLAPLASAIAFGLLGVTLSVVATAGTTSAWYPVALQLLLVPATVLGGWMRARQLVTRH